jgi:3-methyladenine DNA glycosylase AlkD
MTNDIVSTIRSELIDQSDADTKDGSKRFFKEPILLHGVKTSLVSKIARIYFQKISGMDKSEVFALCEELLKSGYSEEAFIAFDWSYRFHKSYQPADFSTFQGWIQNYVDNWAKCDTLCNHTVGAFIEQFPQYLNNLKQWTGSNNRWMRRASAVSLIIPAKKGLFLKDIMEIADSLLMDKDDLVQKGYGWMLKEASRTHQQEIFEYIMRHKAVMPRTALRYAIEKMPDALRKQAMSK